MVRTVGTIRVWYRATPHLQALYQVDQLFRYCGLMQSISVAILLAGQSSYSLIYWMTEIYFWDLTAGHVI